MAKRKNEAEAQKNAVEVKKGEVLLKVENLCQYFGKTKAVDNVSFDIKKGEVFGLVGESGCGKTTTGRSIIKLYDITSGNIIFKGVRIGAGKRSYRDAIAKARADYKEAVAAHPEQKAELKAKMDAVIAEQRELLKKADFDQKNCDKEYSKNLQAACKMKYPRIDPRPPLFVFVLERTLFELRAREPQDELLFQFAPAIRTQRITYNLS